MRRRKSIRHSRRPNHPVGVILVLLSLLCCSTALATEDGRPDAQADPWGVAAWNLQTSLYTHHFDPDPDHNNDQNLIAIEAVFNNDWVAGATVFDNSFDQPSQLVFVGKTWPIRGSRHWYFKLMGGLLHGYKDEYEDKIPLNGLGVAPAVIPALGFRYQRVLFEANLGGLAVITLNAGIRF